MILADTSVWIDHLRAPNGLLIGHLEAGRVAVHPFVIGELALGHLRHREVVLGLLAELPKVSVALDAEVLHFIDGHDLAGRGIGYVDAHLLAAVRLTPGYLLWTRDRRLHAVADVLGMAWA